jgi:tRNA threonylcarbamoyladenosine biosynthesis protein TsaE
LKYPYNILTTSTDETTGLAREFASSLKGGEVVVLNGNLGAGKTFFIKRVGEYLGINNVNSPTFAIVNEFHGDLKINHFDFYRINSASELYNIGIDDYLAEENAVTFIEWGSLFPEVLPEHRIEINISIRQERSREFIFEKHE